MWSSYEGHDGETIRSASIIYMNESSFMIISGSIYHGNIIMIMPSVSLGFDLLN